MHLRPPSIDKGVQAFLWALVFFLFLYFGMLSVDISQGTSLIVALVVAFFSFVLIRTRGDIRDGR